MGIGKNIKLIVIDQNIAPFSWMKYIVISRTDWKDNRDSIIRHEMAHIQYRHSWDIFISELCTVFHWFNPAAWLLKQELQNIHEYEADESVINQGIDVKQYQLLLIKKAVGTQRFNSMANSFNHSKLKKRITMMLKKKSNPWARMKYLYVLPLAAMAVTAFARPEISNELNEISALKVTDLPVIMETVEAETPLNEVKLISDKSGPVQSIRKDTTKRKGTIMVFDITPSEQEGVAKSITEFTENNLTEYNNDQSIIKTNPLVLVDGEEVSLTILGAIDANRIRSVKVLKDEAAKVYGEKGVNGVMLIELSKESMNDFTGVITSDVLGEPLTEFSGKVIDDKGKPVVGANVLLKTTKVGTITNLDGNFILRGPEDTSLIVSYIGMKTVETKPGKNMKIQLKAE